MPGRYWFIAVARPSRAVFFALSISVLAAPLARSTTSTEPNLKVAFVGDQGSDGSTQAVLRLIKSEGADMLLILGDFDYQDNPARWDAMITSTLGADFPVFSVVGNHDVDRWGGAGGYQARIRQRLQRIAGASCSGDIGVKSSCRYRGLFFILSGAGTMGSGHESYIRQQLEADQSTWRIAAWHKNQQEMQVGGKQSEVGWGPYETARELGAIIATGHEHSYSRTKTLVDMQRQRVDPDSPDPARLRVAPGATFAFVSGLGGRSIRQQLRCLDGCNGEWASIYTSDQGAQYGALFIEFHVNGDPNAARGYFKNVRGQIIDRFTITAGTRVLASAEQPTRDERMATVPRESREAPLTPPRETRETAVTPPRETRVSPAAPPRETREAKEAPPQASSPPAASAPSSNGDCLVSRDHWHGAAFALQRGTFSVEFDIVPERAPINAITGLSLGRADDYDDLAAAVRFSPEGVIDACDGDRFAARTSIPYEPGARYHVRMVVRVHERTYDVHVTPPEGGETALALRHRFRSEQKNVTALNHWAAFARAGSHRVCGFSGPSAGGP